MAKQGTILIVDDSPEIRQALRLLFEVEEYRVVGEAANGPEGVALAGECQPAFVILDQVMPGLTGEDTAAFIRQVSPFSLIVAFSAWLDGRPPWADAYLNKDRIHEISPLLSDLWHNRGRPAASDARI